MQTNRKITLITLSCLLIGTYSAIYFYSSKPTYHPQAKSKIELLSESAGYLSYKLENKINPNLDIEAFIRGVRSYSEKKPLSISLEEMIEISEEAEYEHHQKNISTNLAMSVEFLSKVSEITLLENELYYERLSEGKGPPVVMPDSTYLFHYTVSIPKKNTLQKLKTIFDTRQKNQPNTLNLSQVIPGFANGVIGMAVGERRKLYIHPKLGYRCMHWNVPPNTVLVIDVELAENSV
jgi:peptidylprolyl isomerase